MSLTVKSALLSVLLLFGLLGVWEVSTPTVTDAENMTEYEMLMGGASDEARVPPPSQIIALAIEQLSDPFYDYGPNDKGIGIQIGYSLYRVLTGYFMAAMIALPIGFLIGMSPLAYRTLDPFIASRSTNHPYGYAYIHRHRLAGDCCSRNAGRWYRYRILRLERVEQSGSYQRYLLYFGDWRCWHATGCDVCACSVSCAVSRVITR